MNSNHDEFKNKLKRSLQKNKITKEIYLSKNVSKDKRCQPNLLQYKNLVKKILIE